MTVEDMSDVGLEMLHKADQVIRALENTLSLSVVELAEAIDQPVSSVYRLLASLVSIGWVDRSPIRGQFRLGIQLVRVGSSFADSLDLRALARPALQTMLDETQLTSYLCIRRGARAVCIERLEGRDVRSLEMMLGSSLPMAVGAAPRAILANLPPVERERLAADPQLLDADDPPPGPLADTLADIAEVRALGYAISDGDVTPGIAAIGAPVFNHRGELEGAISLSGLREMVFQNTDRNIRIVLESAARTSASLGLRNTAS